MQRVLRARIRVDAAIGGEMGTGLLALVGVGVVSQFTLFGDVRRGRRPSFTAAGLPEMAELSLRINGGRGSSCMTMS